MAKNNIDVSQYIHPIIDEPQDFDIVMHHIAEASIVLMGEATHGTREFYDARADIAKRLIIEKGFRTIALEADFPDTYHVNQYINFQSKDKSVKEALGDFKRFPQWMWRNESMIAFIEWLCEFNDSQPVEKRVQIYGLDLYSLHRSIAVLIAELEKIDPQVAQEAKKQYACFDVYKDPQEYGYYASMLPDKSCHEAVIKQLQEMKRKEVNFFAYDQLNPLEEKFYIEQNALVIKNAELYYRTLFGGTNALSWNVRDQHMAETAKEIEKYNKAAGRDHKMIIWAHNSHVGNANATQMASYGEINVGQLIKEAYGAQAVSIGFTTYTGMVSAASAWGADVERKYVRPAVENSVEAFFHNLRAGDFIIIPAQHADLYEFFNHDDYLERAIGVVYLPHSERASHYFYTQLAEQFDIVIHYDTTHAVIPLERSTEWEKGEDVPETFPFGV